MEKAIIISRCSTNENRQDVTRQSQELITNYGGQYDIVKEFTYYKSGTKNDEVNAEILDYAIKNEVKHIIALEISRISRKISSFALFLEKCNDHKINIIIDNFKLKEENKDAIAGQEAKRDAYNETLDTPSDVEIHQFLLTDLPENATDKQIEILFPFIKE